MALIHAATISPTKAELIADWLPSQPWGASREPGGLELVGAYRFDDPEGEVGLETHLVRAGGDVLQVPLSYRGAPLDGAALVTTMEHSVLGRRWVYDGLTDPVYLAMLAAVTLTGVGQSAQLMTRDGRRSTRAPTVVVHGGGLTDELMPVDGFGPPADDDGWSLVRSPELELRFAHLPAPAPASQAGIGFELTGTWAGRSQPVLLATVALRVALRGGAAS